MTRCAGARAPARLRVHAGVCMRACARVLSVSVVVRGVGGGWAGGRMRARAWVRMRVRFHARDKPGWRPKVVRKGG